MVPVTRMEHGEARDLYPAGIAVNDEEGVFVAGSSSGKMRVVLLVLKGEKGSFQKFKHDFCLKANMLDLIDQFVGEEKRRVPIGDPLKSRRMLL